MKRVFGFIFSGVNIISIPGLTQPVHYYPLNCVTLPISRGEIRRGDRDGLFLFEVQKRKKGDFSRRREEVTTGL